MANIPWLRAVSALCHTEEQPLAVVYWAYTTPPLALIVN
jgi:hypothetical protein